MNTCKCHYCQEEKQGNFCSWFFHSFLLDFERGALFCRKAFISTGRYDRLKLGNVLDQTEHVGGKTRRIGFKSNVKEHRFQIFKKLGVKFNDLFL